MLDDKKIEMNVSMGYYHSTMNDIKVDIWIDHNMTDKEAWEKGYEAEAEVYVEGQHLENRFIKWPIEIDLILLDNEVREKYEQVS